MTEFIDDALIRRLLPYGEEALFLESAVVTRSDDGASILAQANFSHPVHTAEHASHFPGRPILAGHFVIEAILQAAALLAVYLIWLDKRKPENFSPEVGVKSFECAIFYDHAHPTEDHVTLSVELGQLGKVQCTFIEGAARVGTRTLCTLNNIRGFAFTKRH